MGTWETLKIIKKMSWMGWAIPMSWSALCFLSKSQQLRETNFPDHAPVVFVEQKLIFFYCIFHIDPELCFDLEESKHNFYKEWKQIENKSMSSFVASRRSHGLIWLVKDTNLALSGFHLLLGDLKPRSGLQAAVSWKVFFISIKPGETFNSRLSSGR